MLRPLFVMPLMVFLITTVLAQPAPIFIEPGGLYIIQGDDAINTVLADYPNGVEVVNISGTWLEVNVDTSEGSVWLNLEQVSVIINVLEASASQLEELRACLRELATLQEIHYIDFAMYTNLDQLFKQYDTPRVCNDVLLEDSTFSEDSYKIIGRVGQTAYSLTPDGGIQTLR